MKNKMLEDMALNLQKAVKRLRIAVIILLCYSIGMTVFAFSEFEIVFEDSSRIEYEIEQDADIGDGDNGSIVQSNDFSNQRDNSIGIYIVLCVAILTAGGVIIYGKSKNKNT